MEGYNESGYIRQHSFVTNESNIGLPKIFLQAKISKSVLQ